MPVIPSSATKVLTQLGAPKSSWRLHDMTAPFTRDDFGTPIPENKLVLFVKPRPTACPSEPRPQRRR
jgi:hypothetical protein